MKTKLVLLTALTLASYCCEAQAQSPCQTFEVTVINSLTNDDDKVYDPHRAPALADVSGTYDAASGTLSLCTSFDVACVRIYKDDALIMEDSHPVTDDGTLYYNLSFYGSGAYRICLFDEEGKGYIGNYVY